MHASSLVTQIRHLFQYKVTVQKSGMVKELCEAVSKYNDKDPNEMVAADVYNNR